MFRVHLHRPVCFADYSRSTRTATWQWHTRVKPNRGSHRRNRRKTSHWNPTRHLDASLPCKRIFLPSFSPFSSPPLLFPFHFFLFVDVSHITDSRRGRIPLFASRHVVERSKFLPRMIRTNEPREGGIKQERLVIRGCDLYWALNVVSRQRFIGILITYRTTGCAVLIRGSGSLLNNWKNRGSLYLFVRKGYYPSVWS